MKQAVINGKIYVEKGIYAQALLVEDGVITCVGTEEEVRRSAGEDFEIYDCQGRTVIPGLNDTHLHFVQFGMVLNRAPIEGSRSVDEVVQRCREFIEEHPQRVKNGLHANGWNQDLFTEGEKRMPNRYDLSRISTEIPVVLERVCGHAISVNSKVIELLGLTEDSPQVPGGQFLKGEDGKLNGIFTENACSCALNLFPPATKEEMREAMESAMDYAVSRGLTSVQSNDAGTSFGGYEKFFSMMHEIYDGDQAKIRYRHQLSFRDTDTYREFLKGEYLDPRYGGDSWLTMGPLKLFKDGSLGARTAYMKNGYVGEPDNHGVDCISKEEMTEFCLLAKEHGMQVATHAIGDAACEETIDCYEKAFVDGENKLRHALVHCQITDRGILERIVEKDIYVMAQPVFIDYDMTILEKLCGTELAATSYNFGTLLREGAHLSYGTDCPVEDCNPFDNLYMAVTRKDRKGNPEGGFFPSECVDVETAVDAYTLESARNEFQEDRKGRLKPGYYADLVVLDRDIFTVDPMEIREILPVMTMVGGKIVYSR